MTTKRYRETECKETESILFIKVMYALDWLDGTQRFNVQGFMLSLNTLEVIWQFFPEACCVLI
ncbi:hypothetical protein W03_21830 [Nitrosomonas sp. PY1]|nr:hypothetical protein W03_21830 [Nitrosomonas sp. PY1]